MSRPNGVYAVRVGSSISDLCARGERFPAEVVAGMRPRRARQNTCSRWSNTDPLLPLNLEAP
jgi:hypothetical protein